MLQTQSLTVTAQDGGQFQAFAVFPATTPAPAIVLIQEIFGVNAVMRDLARAAAAEGFVALVPDLFWRQQPGVDLTDRTQAEWDQAFALMQGFDVDQGVRDLAATLSFARTLPQVQGHRVATQGYCLGGKLAFLCATRTDGDAHVGYYGVGLGDLLSEVTPTTGPLLLHMAEQDRFMPAEERDRVIAALADHPRITTHLYPGVDHAFARVGGDHYDAAAALLANTRTADFLSHHLNVTTP